MTPEEAQLCYEEGKRLWHPRLGWCVIYAVSTSGSFLVRDGSNREYWTNPDRLTAKDAPPARKLPTGPFGLAIARGKRRMKI
jgi:hypothetical protein